VIEDGLKDTVAPLGAPLAVSATLCVTPLVTAVPIVLVADWPAVAVKELGDALTEKSSAAGVVTVALVRVDWLPAESSAVT
jgi:hypothetical protein